MTPRATLAATPTVTDRSLPEPTLEQPWADLSDHAIAARAAAVVARPPASDPDSFILHAALELGARVDLLAMVRPSARNQVRTRIDDIRATYEDRPTVPEPASGPPAGDAAAALVRAVSSGDVDGADAAATLLASTASPSEIVLATADLLVPALTAAGHGVIALDRMQRVRPGDPVGAAGVRLLARAAAAHPDRRLTWHLDRPRSLPGAPKGRGRGDRGVFALVDCLLAPPSPGELAIDFVHPTLHLTESSGLAREALGAPLAAIDDPAAAGRALLRVAAWSMLQDDPARAPYGWTHCLTLPLATLGIAGACADPGDALAVAATYVLAFRATQGVVALDVDLVPAALGDGSMGALLDAVAGRGAGQGDGADEGVGALTGAAAGALWRAPDAALPVLVEELCSHAAAHPDAHLAKYTLACLHASARDPGAGRLYLAAAAHLGAWWRARDARSAFAG